ncbi:hypothetical protein F4677DRAFT_416307 [Hypoxylon crocopeplum]|nr:hypothetical protein F4677DRAFT_416307 [Hypoxylon crocopeplum]
MYVPLRVIDPCKAFLSCCLFLLCVRTMRTTYLLTRHVWMFRSIPNLALQPLKTPSRQRPVDHHHHPPPNPSDRRPKS